MNKTKIEWCDSTWNPVTGCLHGCEYCYARKQARRFMGCNDIDEAVTGKYTYSLVEPLKITRKNGETVNAPYPFGFNPTFHKYRLDEPQKWKKPRTIFVCSMADLFGKWVPDEWIEAVFEACEKAPQHRYLFLTKNPKRYQELANKNKLPQLSNMWYGTSVTGANMKYFSSYGMYNTFISVEPLLEPFSTSFEANTIKWLIIGAQTGNSKNKIVPRKSWIDFICTKANEDKTPVFIKDSLIPIMGKENMRREFPWKQACDIINAELEQTKE